MKKIVYIPFILVLSGLVVLGTSCGNSGNRTETLVFADLSWDSVQVHNRIASFIIEKGFVNYEVEYIPGDTLVSINGLAQGDIDIDMESWHSNFKDVYDRGVATGDIIDLGKNLPDAPQAWWVPRYLVEGPDAPAPDLKSIADLPRYADLFTDPEDPDKGIIYAGVSGWGQLTRGEELFEDYGLEESFNMGIAGSGAALAATMVGAYEKSEAWVGYYWAPTAIMGRLDMVPLRGSEYPPTFVNILVNSTVPERAPDVVDFLKQYSTTIEDNNEFLAKMETEGWDSWQTALWFLKYREDVWTQWVNDRVAQRVREALALI